MKVKLDVATMRHLKHLVQAVLEQEDSYIRNEMGTDEEHDGGVILDDEILAATAEAHPGGGNILWLHAHRVFVGLWPFQRNNPQSAASRPVAMARGDLILAWKGHREHMETIRTYPNS